MQFVQMGQSMRMTQMGNININSAIMNPAQCIMTASVWSAFLMYSAMMSSTSASGNINYQSLSTMMMSGSSNNMYMMSASTMAMYQAQLMNFRTSEATYAAAKAACTKAVFKHLIAVTCLAASSMYSTYVSGTMMAPMLKERMSSCMVYQTACIPYYTSAMMQMTSINWIQECQSSAGMQVAMLLSNSTTFSASVNTQLNSIYTTQVMAMATASQMSPNMMFAGLMCNSSNQNAADCNFICNNVINATGIKMDAYDNLNTAATMRNLADASMMFTSDNSGLAPDMVVMDSDAMVGQEMMAGMSSAFGLAVSFIGLIGGLLLL